MPFKDSRCSTLAVRGGKLLPRLNGEAPDFLLSNTHTHTFTMEQTERQQRLVSSLIDAGLISPSYTGCEDSAVQVIGRLLGEGNPEFSHKLVQGRRLAYVRTEVKSWSQQMLLERVNIYLAQVLAPRIGGHTTISRIETGQYDMTYATAIAFSMAMGVSPTAFSPWLSPLNFGGATLLPSQESLALDHTHH